MTKLNLKAETRFGIEGLVFNVEFMEEQQGHESDRPYISPDRGDDRFLSVQMETPVDAADIVAYFNYTGLASTSVKDDIVTVTPLRREDQGIHQILLKVQPLEYAGAQPF